MFKALFYEGQMKIMIQVQVVIGRYCRTFKERDHFRLLNTTLFARYSTEQATARIESCLNSCFKFFLCQWGKLKYQT